jgi:glyoxylase-like metal-dependent hydrolase (beta-lactamase superfamily II)
MRPILDNLFLFEDTCFVYVIRSGTDAVLVDFGNGDVLEHLDKIGVRRVTDVLLTHHHRDQCQRLDRAAEAGIRIWVPYNEQDLFRTVDAHWQARELYMNYLSRQDRFSLLEPVAIDGTLEDYATYEFGSYRFTIVPTPGHTVGSITLLAEIGGVRAAFTGDLIAGPGKVWSLAATQWSYNGAEGAAAGIASLLDLKERKPDILLPSHGEPLMQPEPAIDLLVDRFWQLLQLRGQNPRLFELRERPYAYITPHLLKHRASFANSYVVLSESRKALFIDFGYDFATHLPSGSDRASRRPWLYTIPTLKREYGVDRIDVVLPTHFHDDHVAGINLLRRVEGTQVWAADFFSDILEEPDRYNLPCLWYDPIPVDRRLPLEAPFQWEEYTFTLYPLPGHTRYAVAISFEVDRRRVLAAGDQYQGNAGLELNYVYANRFDARDYIKSAELYRRLCPDLILTGHWEPLWVTPEYFDKLEKIGTDLERLHRELQLTDLGEEGFIAWLYPYQTTVKAGQPVEFQIDVLNPFNHPAEATIQVAMPKGWRIVDAASEMSEVQVETPRAITLSLAAGSTASATFTVMPSADVRVRRARIGADVTVDGRHFGQQAEALVTTV